MYWKYHKTKKNKSLLFRPRKGMRKRERNGLQKSPGRRLALE
jgi:hypothetical protein